MKKKIRCSYAVLVIILFAALAFVTDYAVIERKTRTCNCPKCEIKNYEVQEENSTDNESTEKIIVKESKKIYNVSELNVKSDLDAFKDISDNENIVETLTNGDEYSAKLDISGNVVINNYKNGNSDQVKLNIKKVIDIIILSRPADCSEQTLYLLTEEGSLYSYKFGNSDKNNYEVTKIETVSNVKKIFISNYSKPNAGGSWALFAITSNNDCIMIESESV